MKTYPTIPHINESFRGEYVFVTDKIDGSNIRAEWSRKRGHFWKVGRRKALLDDTNPILAERVPPLVEALDEPFDKLFKALRCQKATAFFEFFGEGSFAGNHNVEDHHSLVLIDVALDRKGLIPPKDFYDAFGEEVPCASLLHRGPWTADLEQQVRDGTLPGMTFEGVVCKSNRMKSPGRPATFKVKSEAWLAKLRNYCAGDETLFERLR